MANRRGKSPDDIGHQLGGWSITCQGESGPTTKGTTILDGIRAAAGPSTKVQFSKDGSGIDGSYKVAVARAERIARGVAAWHRRRRGGRRPLGDGQLTTGLASEDPTPPATFAGSAAFARRAAFGTTTVSSVPSTASAAST